MKSIRVASGVMFGTLAACSAVMAQQSGPPPRSAAATTAASEARAAAGPFPQGFSVVLVLGDLQSTAPSDDVPQAARKALTDMKDFLPYKSYKLLDAAFVMCCAEGGRRVGLPGGQSLRESSSVNTVLRGLDDQEFWLQLRTYRTEGSRIFVSFVLNATGASPLEKLAEKAKELESAPQGRPAVHASRSVIDTSFTMDVGETIVVGTSRMRNGPKALIALLTAVPPRNGTTRE